MPIRQIAAAALLGSLSLVASQACFAEDVYKIGISAGLTGYQVAVLTWTHARRMTGSASWKRCSVTTPPGPPAGPM